MTQKELLEHYNQTDWQKIAILEARKPKHSHYIAVLFGRIYRRQQLIEQLEAK